MITNEADYRRLVHAIAEQRQRIEQQAARLKEEGLGDEQVGEAVQPLWAFHRQRVADADRYECIKRGEFEVLRNLEGIGELLVALRIHLGVTQAELAERLGIDVATVGRDERNEYHGITLEQAARIIDAMGVEVRTTVETPVRTTLAWRR